MDKKDGLPLFVIKNWINQLSIEELSNSWNNNFIVRDDKMGNLEKTILEEQLYVFLRFLEANEFIDFSNLITDDVSKDDLVQSIIFNFIDTYGV